MVDKVIGELPQASTITDNSSFVCEDSGEAKRVTGKQFKDFAKQGVSDEAEAQIRAIQSVGNAQTQRVIDEGTIQTANATAQANAAAESATSAANSAAVYDNVVADVTQLKQDLSNKFGVLDYSFTDGYSVVSESGGLYPNSNYSYATIKVIPKTVIYGYTRGGVGKETGCAFYDAKGNYISGLYNEASTNYDWNYRAVVPTGAVICKISCASTRKADFTCNFNNVIQSVADIAFNLNINQDRTDRNTNIIGNLEYHWKNGYLLTVEGNEVKDTRYSYMTCDVSMFRGQTISGYSRMNMTYPAIMFFDNSDNVISYIYNTTTDYDFYFNDVAIPLTASFVKIGCTIAKQGDFILEASNLLCGLQNINKTTPLVYEVPYFVNALKGNKADFAFDSNTRLQDIYDWYDELVSVFPSNFTRVQIGTTTTPTGTYADIDNNTYPIYAYEYVGKNANDNNKFIIAGGIHGDEQGGDGIQGVCACAYFVKDMLYNAKSEYLKFMKNNCKIVFVPVINPWGYQNGKRCNGRGVDLNRNFDYNFEVGTSYGYSTGESAFSENESSAFRDYISNHTDSKFMCEIHARGGDVLPDDARWFIISNGERTTGSLYETLKRCCNKMISFYGGTLTINQETGSNLVATCFAWVDKVLDIPSYEPEFFKSCNMDIKTLNKQAVMIQCTHFMGIMIQSLVNQFMEIN